MTTETNPNRPPDPTNIRLFLRTKGWTQATDPADIDPPDTPDVWVLPATDGTYEVIAPTSSENRGFDKVVAELIRTVAVAENRAEQDVRNSLESLDVIMKMLADS